MKLGAAVLHSMIVLGLAAAGRAGATTVIVPIDYPTIQAAIDASVSMDTVGVRPGDYVESLYLAGKDLMIRADFIGFPLNINPTVRAPAGSRALTIGPGVTSATVFQMMIFTGGLADSGGGAFVAEASACTFRQCLFVSNSARGTGPSCSLGGGLYVGRNATTRVYDSAFQRNSAQSGQSCDGYGGAIYLSEGAVLTARNVQFLRNLSAGLEGGPGGAVAIAAAISPGGASATFEECVFDTNLGSSGGIEGRGRLSVDRCLFRGNIGVWGASAIGFVATSEFKLTRSVFHGNSTLAGNTVVLRGTGIVDSCTLAFNGNSNPGIGFGGCLAVDAGTCLVRNNIIARNRSVGLYGISGPAPESAAGPASPVSCNDVWQNADGEYGGVYPDLTGFDGNISVDPVFCDSTSRALGLWAHSPCASAGDCGRIGAFGVLCPPLDAPEPAAPNADLLSIRPNPLRAATTVGFVLAHDARVQLEIVDVAGRRIARLADGVFPRGRHDLVWSGRTGWGDRAEPGIYFVRIEAGALRMTKRLVVMD